MAVSINPPVTPSAGNTFSYIGRNVANTAVFTGVIDEVRVYNRALSAGEINKLYQMGR